MARRTLSENVVFDAYDLFEVAWEKAPTAFKTKLEVALSNGEAEKALGRLVQVLAERGTLDAQLVNRLIDPTTGTWTFYGKSVLRTCTAFIEQDLARLRVKWDPELSLNLARTKEATMRDDTRDREIWQRKLDRLLTQKREIQQELKRPGYDREEREALQDDLQEVLNRLDEVESNLAYLKEREGKVAIAGDAEIKEKLSKLYKKRDSLRKELSLPGYSVEERYELRDTLNTTLNTIEELESELEHQQEREGTVASKPRMSRRLAKQVGSSDSLAFDFLVGKLMDTNSTIKDIEGQLEELQAEEPLEEDEVAPAPTAEQSAFEEFLRLYVKRAKDCRDFLLEGLWELWGVEEEEVTEAIEEEEE